MADPMLMLTPLKSGHNFKAATNFGRWEPLSGTLGELGDALDVAETAEVDVVRSTPDPWAQARTFADAVSGAHPDGRTLGQWRGLLALFALSDFYADRYTLDLTALDLTASSTRFAEVMRRLVPGASLPMAPGRHDAAWDKPYLLRIVPAGRGQNVVTVGLLNPACLVAGGRDLDRMRIDAVPWAKNGWKDPATLSGPDSLPPAALQVLSSFLLRLKEEAAVLCGSDGTDAEQLQLRALQQQLERYASDCVDPARHPGVADHVFRLFPPQRWGDDLPALFSLLTAVQKVAEPEPGTSDCIIALREDLGGKMPFKGLVLLDPGMATAERPANTITFWGLRTLEDALFSGPSALATLKATMAEHGYLVIGPDEIFAPVLVQLDEPDRPARIDAHPETMRDHLLPISPLALLLRTPDKLRDTMSVGRDGRVSLDILLGGRPYRLTRRYVEKPATGQGRLVREADWGLGDFVLWPNFTSDLWSNYCARIDYPTNSLGRVRGRFAASGSLIAGLLEEAQPDMDALKTWGAGVMATSDGRTGLTDVIPSFGSRSLIRPGLTRFRASASGGRTSEVQIATLPYEAVFYAIALDADAPPMAAGCALLRIAPVATGERHVRSAAVAIDFGTTNTVACLETLDPVKLEARVVHPIAPAKNGSPARTVELAQKLKDFLPVDDRLLPTPTVIIGRSLDAEGRDLLDADSELDDALLVRHAMYFQPDFAEDGTIATVPLREWSTLLNSIRYDLKWSRNREMRDGARRFLRQLIMMISAEWARRGGDPKKLAWHFSRPRDMGDDREFVDQIRKALDDVVPNAPAGAVRPLTYEGDAAAEYILDERTKGSGTKGMLNVILDIGGGTTDIAVWGGGSTPKQLLSSSLRIAGGDFFTDHIMANPEILADFGLRTWADVVRQLGRESDASLRDNIRYIGELLFSGRTLDGAIERSWSRVSGTDHVRALKEISFLFLGGLAWYVGRQLRELIRSGEIDRAALQDVAIAFCGRGSGLFRRLHGQDPRAQTEVSRILLLVAVAAGESRPRSPQVQVSPHPKIEVAAGMMLMSAREPVFPGDTPAETPDAGLQFETEEDTALSPTKEGGLEDAYFLAPLDVGIEDLDPFLRAFAKVSGFTLEIADHQRAKLVNGVIDLDRADAQAKRGRQPEFAAVLKILVGLMSAQRDDPIRPKARWN